MLNYED